MHFTNNRGHLGYKERLLCQQGPSNGLHWSGFQQEQPKYNGANIYGHVLAQLPPAPPPAQAAAQTSRPAPQPPLATGHVKLIFLLKAVH